MKLSPVLAIILVLLFSCDDQRLFEENTDFNSRFWSVDEKPSFEFSVDDTLGKYNLYCNVRNDLDYPFSRIFINWELKDSTGAVLEKELVQHTLFDEKTGKPFGESGLGDIYNHRIPIRSSYQFPYAGKFSVAFQQYMRMDTLGGVLAVGVRLERFSPETK
jgi:gliding motility-associated lipoprotein GldH